MKLYHFKIGFPKGTLTACRGGIISLRYTKHAERASKDDRYGVIKLPNKINTNKAKVIEVEIKKDRVSKVVYRVKYNHECDLVLVVNPDCSVRTVWLNKKEDKHSTLDLDRYDVPA